MSSDPRRLSRRSFLRRTLLGGALLTVSATLGRHLTGYALDPVSARRLRVLSVKEYLVLAAICRRILAPDERGAIGPDEIGSAFVIDEYLAGMPRPLADDVKALLQLVEHSPFVFSLRASRFSHLDGPAQDEVLAGWEGSRIELRRQGFAALKGLAMIGYYGDPRAYAITGFTGPMLPSGTP